jgi:aldehyde:ferredoxin oxidoreductase
LDIESGLNGIVETINGFLRTEIDLTKYGTEILKNEREFNKQADFTAKDDTLPEFFHKEPLPPHNVAFDGSDEELDKVHNYYGCIISLLFLIFLFFYFVKSYIISS